MRVSKARYAYTFLTAGILTLTAACSSGGGSGNGDNGGKATISNYAIGTAADSQGPAVPVAGAKKGGTVYPLEDSGFDYLDPAQQYVSRQQSVSLLYNRTLTGYKINPRTGKAVLVGDLATDTGKPSDGAKTWTYTLKTGVKFEDGTAITSKDIKYGIERLFADFETQGPQYVQQWLYAGDYRKAYAGPYGGKEIPSSLIGTPNARTIVFHFREPHADAPYAMALPNISPVPKAKDDKQKYNNHPVSTGPYKIASYQSGKELVFARNPNWDPKTDPIRNAYPDKWDYQLNIAEPGLTDRLAAGSGNDKYSLNVAQSADPSKMSSLANDARYKARTVNEYQSFVELLNINTRRIKDVRVRQAIMYAFPMAQVQQALGGGAQGELGTTLLSPTIAGWRKYDPFGKLTKPTGDIVKAKQLLKEAGQPHPKLVYAYSNVPKWQNVSLTVANALEKAGFNVQRKAIDPTSYYTLVSKLDSPYDLFRTSWAADWPNASTVVPPTLDGRNLTDGTNNYSFLDDSHVSSEIDRISAMTDLPKQSVEWRTLSEYVLKNDTSQIPFIFDKYFNIYGSGLGGVTYNQVIGALNPSTVYVKQ
jgi:peptide/nickel transport system substrate-binding protein